jgi:hypothetical protein
MRLQVFFLGLHASQADAGAYYQPGYHLRVVQGAFISSISRP